MSILIRNGTVVTMEHEVITDGAIFIVDDRVVEVGRTDVVVKKYKTADEVIDARGKLVLPGFINAHDHTDGDRLMRGFGIDVMVAVEYFRKYKWPMLMEMKDEDFYRGALVGYIENIKSGVTLVADNYYTVRGGLADGVPEAAQKVGIRSVLVRGYHDLAGRIPDEFIESTDSLPKTYSDLFRKWHNSVGGMIKVWIGPVNLLYCTAKSVTELNDLAKQYGSGLHSHVAEDRLGAKEIKERFGKGYIESLYEMGVLGPRFQAAHCIWVSEEEISLLHKTRTTVVHNPVGNMMLCAGVAPVTKMRDFGVNVALGGDTKSDIISSMRFAACLQKISAMNPTVITAYQALEMATINGAKAYGLENEVGTIKAGKKADITIVDMKQPHLSPVKDPIIALVYFANSSDVDTVIINGKIVMKNRRLLTVDEEQAIVKAEESAQRIFQTVAK